MVTFLLGVIYILVIIAPTVLLHLYLYTEHRKDFENKSKRLGNLALRA